MKIRCTTCHGAGNVARAFAFEDMQVLGFFSEKIRIKSTGEIFDVRNHPMEKCLTCDGTGWMERSVDLEVKVSK